MFIQRSLPQWSHLCRLLAFELRTQPSRRWRRLRGESRVASVAKQARQQSIAALSRPEVDRGWAKLVRVADNRARLATISEPTTAKNHRLSMNADIALKFCRFSNFAVLIPRQRLKARSKRLHSPGSVQNPFSAVGSRRYDRLDLAKLYHA